MGSVLFMALFSPLPIDHELIKKMCDRLPQQPQKQYSTNEQLAVLYYAANRLGLYDAADYLRNVLSEEVFGQKFSR
jgi:hypothetical protein